MFLDFIQSDERNGNTRYDYKNVQVRMPQIILLIGEYEDKEIVLLENGLKKHFPVKDYLFWISIGKANLPDNDYKQGNKTEKEGILNAHLKKIEINDENLDLSKRRDAYSIFIKDKKREGFLEDTIAEIYNATSRLDCAQPGSIYVSVIGKADQFQSGMIVPVIKKMEEKLQEQFLLTYVDLYMLLDQRAIGQGKTDKEASIYASLHEAEKMMQDHTLRFAYVLSNENDNGRLLESENALREQYASIALMMSVKNLLSESLVYRYIDEEFGRGVANKASEQGTDVGWLSSLGHMHLSIDEDFINKTAYLAIWKKVALLSDLDKQEELIQKFSDEMERNRIERLFSSEIKKVTMEEIDFHSIVRNKNMDEHSIYTMTNGNAIAEFWGNNLKLYYDLNVQKSNAEKIVNEWKDRLEQKINTISVECEIFDIVNIFTVLIDDIKKRYSEAKEIADDKERKFFEWEGTNVSSGIENRRNGNPLLELAETYIKKRNELHIAIQKKNLYQEMQEKISDLYVYYRKYYNLALQTIESLEKELEEKERIASKPGNGLERLQVTNSKKYYLEKTTQVLENKYFKLFQKLSAEIRQMILGKTYQEKKLYQMIKDYCERYVLTDQCFHMGFLEELQERLIGYQDDVKWEIRSKTDVSNFLLTTIVDTQHTLLCDEILQGFQSYEEMCLFLQDDSLFLEEKDISAHAANIIREQKMKLFCDKKSPILDVLFIAGNLKAQNVHKWRNYEESYEEIMERK